MGLNKHNRKYRARHAACMVQLRTWRRAVGAALHEARLRDDMSLFRLARLSHIAADRLERFERGGDEISPEEIVRLSVLLDTDFSTLFFARA